MVKPDCQKTMDLFVSECLKAGYEHVVTHIIQINHLFCISEFQNSGRYNPLKVKEYFHVMADNAIDLSATSE